MNGLDKWQYIGGASQELEDIIGGMGSPEFEDEERFRSSKVYAKFTPRQRLKSEQAYISEGDWGVLEPADPEDTAL